MSITFFEGTKSCAITLIEPAAQEINDSIRISDFGMRMVMTFDSKFYGVYFSKIIPDIFVVAVR